jgi:hypothetical protein
MSGGSAKR